MSQKTVRRYLALLTDALVIRQLQPWHANLKKRQVKSPKIYVRDCGLLHQLLGIGTEKAADAPKVTPSMRNALDDLELERIAVIYPGTQRFALGDRVEAVPLHALAEGGSLFRDRS